MSQADIIKYLRKVKRPVDMLELVANLPYNRATISRNCNKLRKTGDVKYKKVQRDFYKLFIYYV